MSYNPYPQPQPPGPSSYPYPTPPGPVLPPQNESKPARLPGPAMATFCFLVVVALFNLLGIIGGRVFNLSSIWITFIAEISLVAALPLIFTLVLRYDFKKVFRPNAISPGTLTLCVLVGLAAQFAVRIANFASSWLLQIFGPLYLPDQYDDGTTFGKWVFLLVAVVLAPICEEILNRGFVMAGYRGLGYWRCILFVGIFFGFFHQYPYRFFDTFLAGMILAYLALTTNSIFASMAAHFGFNILGGIVNFFREDINRFLRESNSQYQYTNNDILLITPDQLVAGLVMSLVGAALVFLLLRVITRRMARARAGMVLNYSGLAVETVENTTSHENGPYYGPANRPFRYTPGGYYPVPAPFPAQIQREPGLVRKNLLKVGWIISILLIIALFVFTSFTELLLRARGREFCRDNPRACMYETYAGPSSEPYIIYVNSISQLGQRSD